MTDPQTAHERQAASERAGDGEDAYPWPPSASAVAVFVVLALMLGGPLTWLAVTR